MGRPRVEEPAYKTVHARLRTDLGPASDYPCAVGGCPEQARQWAYLHVGGPDHRRELIRGAGNRLWLVSFSVNPQDYKPLCLSHHRRLDLQRQNQRRAE